MRCVKCGSVVKDPVWHKDVTHCKDSYNLLEAEHLHYYCTCNYDWTGPLYEARDAKQTYVKSESDKIREEQSGEDADSPIEQWIGLREREFDARTNGEISEDDRGKDTEKSS